MNTVEKIRRMINEEETERMIRWVKTWGKNHGIMPDEKGFFDKCVASMDDELGDDGAKRYCARAIDTWKSSTYWRGKGKTEKEAEQDVEANQNYPRSKAKRRKAQKAKEE